jgi:DNA polymerase-1
MKQRLPVRSPHRALNTLLQGAGATVMKCATVRMHKAFMREKLTYNDVRQVAHIHDEVQFQVRTEVAELVGQLLKQSIQETTDYLSLRCPMDGDYRIGRTWAETH